jgi:hypothetical protein
VRLSRAPSCAQYRVAYTEWLTDSDRAFQGQRDEISSDAAPPTGMLAVGTEAFAPPRIGRLPTISWRTCSARRCRRHGDTKLIVPRRQRLRSNSLATHKCQFERWILAFRSTSMFVARFTTFAFRRVRAHHVGGSARYIRVSAADGDLAEFELDAPLCTGST